ncbi:MAG: MFS transporter [Patescibacteria group bacterium]
MPLINEKTSWKSYFNIRKINVVIRLLTFVDLIVIGGFGLIAPIFAVYITDTIKGGTVEVVGIASGIYLISKAISQIPVGIIVDKIPGEKDDFWFMFAGHMLFSIAPLFYIVISTPLQLYIFQFFYGLVVALAAPTWCAIFTRHIDKNYEGIEWASYTTLTELGAAGTAFLGGLLAYRFGFNVLFILVSIASFVGSIFLLGIYRKMRPGKVLF